ncbi:hypothetical protein GQ600_2953 [Phytophthora cactorum]|nr:hypothetical protein GQ600_2953 [Phytophthora cactorum]
MSDARLRSVAHEPKPRRRRWIPIALMRGLHTNSHTVWARSFSALRSQGGPAPDSRGILSSRLKRWCVVPRMFLWCACSSPLRVSRCTVAGAVGRSLGRQSRPQGQRKVQAPSLFGGRGSLAHSATFQHHSKPRQHPATRHNGSAASAQPAARAGAGDQGPHGFTSRQAPHFALAPPPRGARARGGIARGSPAAQGDDLAYAQDQAHALQPEPHEEARGAARRDPQGDEQPPRAVHDRRRPQRAAYALHVGQHQAQDAPHGADLRVVPAALHALPVRALTAGAQQQQTATAKQTSTERRSRL